MLIELPATVRKRLRDGAGAAIQLPHPKRGWADGIDVAITDGVNVDVAEEKEEEEEEVEEEEEEDGEGGAGAPGEDDAVGGKVVGVDEG